MDRMRGAMEMKFSSFLPIRDGGDVPFHRLRYYRSPRGLLYDRKSGVDCVFEAAQFGVEAGYGIPPNETLQAAIKEAQRNREIIEYNAVQRQKRKKQRWMSSRSKKTSGSGGAINDQKLSSLNRIPIFKFDQTWVNTNDDESVLSLGDESLVVISFNVLFDRFEVEGEIDPEATLSRWTALLNHVSTLKGRHVIAFQEATPTFATLLMEQDWVREQYYSTLSNEDTSTIDPDGQILLSRFPIVRAIRHDFSKSKRVLINELDIYGRRLLVPSLVCVCLF